MGLDPITIGIALVGIGTAANVYGQIESRNAQKKIQGEQRASNAREAALERRQQIREERVRRAQLLQASENTGVTGSSGQIGAEMALNTNLAANVATNVGRLESAQNISIFQQDAANAQFIASMGSTLASVGQTIGGKT